MKKLIDLTNRLLKEYSPLALLIMVLPFFLAVDSQLLRRLILLLCAGPGLLLAILNPKETLKNSVLLLAMLFVAYFSAQDLRGLNDFSFPTIRWQVVRGAVLLLPAVLLSFATPNRKLYALPLRLILLVSAGVAGFSLISFYANNPFPTARLELMVGNYTFITYAAMLCGFCAVIAGGLFLQNGSRITPWNTIELICLPVLLAGMLYTHTRSSLLAVLATLAVSLFTLKSRWKKLLCIYTIFAVTVLIYGTTLRGAESIPKKELRQTKAAVERSLPEDSLPSSGKKIMQREGGVFDTGQSGRFSINHRLVMWKCHLSRLNHEKKWLTGFGLGMNNFVQDVPEEQQWLYYIGDYGWEIHTHSGYVWALYFGGVVGLALLLLLLGAAGVQTLRAGQSGILGFALIVFCAVFMLVDTKSLLTGTGGVTYLLLWVPLGLAAGNPKKRVAPDIPFKP